MTDLSRRAALGAGALGLTAMPLAAPAVAQGRISWNMVTSWPKNLPGPGVTARRIAEGIAAASDNRLNIKLHAAGELVPAFGVFDAVSSGTAQLAHTASLFWAGKAPAAPIFTAAPFGLTPLEHITWIDHGGGQALWDRLYAPFGIKPLMAGNTGFQMGGWFRREIHGPDDIKGLKIRMPGFGGAIARQLGATPVPVAPGEIQAALRAGTIDAAEFLGPWSDAALGLFEFAPYYYWPGFHEPNGTGEALIGLDAWAKLPNDLQAIVVQVCARENIRGLGEAQWNNAHALKILTDEKGVKLRAFPETVLAAARQAATGVLDTLAGEDALTGEIVASYRAARQALHAWSRISQAALLSARR